MSLPASSILASSWTTAAPGYNEIFVPRFQPWTDDALKHLQTHARTLPPGIVLVPCCGPGQELPPIARLLGGAHAVLGTDLAPGMVEIAAARCAAAVQEDGTLKLSAAVGDAMQP